METGNKVIIVELTEPYNGYSRWLFGSKKAIYDHLPASIVGVSLTTLQCHTNLLMPYTTQTGSVLSQHTLHRAKTNRGKKRRE
jgi:hypothetical protein